MGNKKLVVKFLVDAYNLFFCCLNFYSYGVFLALVKLGFIMNFNQKPASQFDLVPSQWLKTSLIHRWVGIIGHWRESSWLLKWAETFAALLLAVVFGLAPFVSTSLIGILLFASATYWFLLTLADTDKSEVTYVHFLVLIYWGIASLAVAFSPVKAEAFSGWLKLTLYLVMFALAARVLRSPRLTAILLPFILVIGLIVGSYGVRQELFGVEQLATWNDPTSPLAGDTRVYSYLGNPNLLAAYLLPLIALSGGAIFVWQGWLKKALALTMLVVNTACLYFTDSRGGWLGMMALSITFMLLLYIAFRNRLTPFWRVWLLPVVFGAFMGLIVVAVILVEPLRLRVLSIFAGREDSSNNFRMNVWLSVLQMIRDYPILGIGPGNDAFNQIYPLYMHPKYSALSSYSVFLETAVETGLVGLSVFLALIGVTIKRGIAQIGVLETKGDLRLFWLIGAIAGMVGLLAQGCFDTVWYRPQVNTLWWFLMALIASQQKAD